MLKNGILDMLDLLLIICIGFLKLLRIYYRHLNWWITNSLRFSCHLLQTINFANGILICCPINQVFFFIWINMEIDDSWFLNANILFLHASLYYRCWFLIPYLFGSYNWRLMSFVFNHKLSRKVSRVLTFKKGILFETVTIMMILILICLFPFISTDSFRFCALVYL